MFGGKGIRRLLPTGINGNQFKTFHPAAPRQSQSVIKLVPTTPKRTFFGMFPYIPFLVSVILMYLSLLKVQGTLSVILKVRQ